MRFSVCPTSQHIHSYWYQPIQDFTVFFFSLKCLVQLTCYLYQHLTPFSYLGLSAQHSEEKYTAGPNPLGERELNIHACEFVITVALMNLCLVKKGGNGKLISSSEKWRVIFFSLHHCHSSTSPSAQIMNLVFIIAFSLSLSTSICISQDSPEKQIQ